MRTRRRRMVDSGIPSVSEAEQELVYAARREQDLAIDRENFEWAAVMRDRQRVLLGSEHPQAPTSGPGLDLHALAAVLHEIEKRAAALRVEVERVATMSAEAAEAAREALTVAT